MENEVNSPPDVQLSHDIHRAVSEARSRGTSEVDISEQILVSICTRMFVLVGEEATLDLLRVALGRIESGEFAAQVEEIVAEQESLN